MFKKLGIRTLAIIMATMLVAGTNIMSAFAVETAIEETETYTYTDESTGIKLESKGMALNEINVSISNYLEPLGWYENQYSVELLDENGSQLNLEDVPVTAYFPCEKENCNVVMGIYADNLFSVESEYVDGYHKVKMSGCGAYSICDYPLAEGEGELVQQTLVDEKTGVSVSGMIQSESTLVVKDIKDMYKEILEEEGFLNGILYGERPASAGENHDGYSVRIARNLTSANTDGELTVTLPFQKGGYEVRCINDYDSFTNEYNKEAGILTQELVMSLDIPAEEMAQKLTAFADKVYPEVEAEYIDGSYVVKNGTVGYYVILPKGSFVVTTDYVEKARQALEEGVNDDDYYEGDKYSDIESTEAQTKTSTQKKDIADQANNNIYVIIAVIGVVAIVAIVTIIIFKTRKLK